MRWNMVVRTTFLIFALQFSLLIPATSRPQTPESLSTKLSKRLTNYNLGTCNFVDALVQVSSEFQIPMGIAWIGTPAARAEVPFLWKEVTVREVIEAIAKQQPGYSVQVRNGVVHIAAPELIPERENFLNLRIKEFQVRNGYTDVAILRLQNLITPAKYSGFSVGTDADEPRISLELRDSTVSDILDGLALASNRKIWIITFSTDPKPTSAGFRKTLALWDTLSPVAEKGEPALNLLHWGDRIPWPSPGSK